MEEYKAEVDTETDSKVGVESKEEQKEVACKDWSTASQEEKNIQIMLAQMKKADDQVKEELAANPNPSVENKEEEKVLKTGGNEANIMVEAENENEGNSDNEEEENDGEDNEEENNEDNEDNNEEDVEEGPPAVPPTAPPTVPPAAPSDKKDE